MLDIFRSNAFGVISLTLTINRLPYKPGLLGAMPLFKQTGITTPVISIEETSGRLMIIPTAARGDHNRVIGSSKRKLRAFPVPHIPLDGAVMADDVQGVRAFGSEDQTEPLTKLVNDKLEAMRQSHELTHEYHRLGAIQGVVYDADGVTVLYNLFTEFGVTEQVVSFDFTDTEDLILPCYSVKKKIGDVLGGVPFTGVAAIAGEDFFEKLLFSEQVKKAKVTDNNHDWLMNVPNTEDSFDFGGITWMPYRGSVGGVPFVPADKARFFPVGVPDLFIEAYAPANYIEAVNTVGKPLYAKQKNMKWDEGIELTSQSNPFFACTRPEVLVRGDDDTP